MRLKSLAAALVVTTMGAGCAASDYPANMQTARTAPSMPEALYRMNGEHVVRFLATPSNTVAESNLTAAGGSASTYTLLGTERLCYECATTDAYVAVLPAASFTASTQGRMVKASNEGGGDLVCDTLNGSLSVSFLCSAAGPCSCKAIEVR